MACALFGGHLLGNKIRVIGSSAAGNPLACAFIVAIVFLAACVQQGTPSSSGQANVDVFFCPADHCEDRAVNAIANSKESVDVAIYSFTSKELFAELLKAQKRGVKVRVVADYQQSTIPSSVVPFLDGNGIHSRIYTKSVTMHDKFAIIDNSLVLTGSYNWTTNADERNRENLVFITDSQVATDYEDEFFRLWATAS